MHATIQKPVEEIINAIRPGEKVFVVGCNNCAWKCHSGGEDETANMAKRLEKRGVDVSGYTVPGPQGMSLCKLDHTRKVLMEDYAEQVKRTDSFLVLGCGQGVHTVIDATDGGVVHPGCDTIFGGETVSETEINEYCSLCGECIVESTGGLCPITLCAKSLLNGPCGGAEDGKCEVDHNRDCGWILIYERLKKLGQLDRIGDYVEPKNNSKWARSRTLIVGIEEATFNSQGSSVTVSNQN